MPWPYLQRTFGVTAESGNNTANVLHNFNERGERAYKINVGMSDLITSSEEAFFRMFYHIELLVSLDISESIFLILIFPPRPSPYIMRWFVPSCASMMTTNHRV